MRKIAIIGTTTYISKMQIYQQRLQSLGYEVKLPAFDSHPEFNELDLCEYNRALVEWADEVHIFWDQRSSGTIFDFGMIFMARKPIRIVYIEKKTFKGLMEIYEQQYASSGNA